VGKYGRKIKKIMVTASLKLLKIVNR